MRKIFLKALALSFICSVAVSMNVYANTLRVYDCTGTGLVASKDQIAETGTKYLDAAGDAKFIINNSNKSYFNTNTAYIDENTTLSNYIQFGATYAIGKDKPIGSANYIELDNLSGSTVTVYAANSGSGTRHVYFGSTVCTSAENKSSSDRGQQGVDLVKMVTSGTANDCTIIIDGNYKQKILPSTFTVTTAGTHYIYSGDGDIRIYGIIINDSSNKPADKYTNASVINNNKDYYAISVITASDAESKGMLKQVYNTSGTKYVESTKVYKAVSINGIPFDATAFGGNTTDLLFASKVTTSNTTNLSTLETKINKMKTTLE